MASGNSAIRGSRVGSGPMGEQDRGFHADRVAVSYWDAQGNETVRYFAANLPEEEIPDVIDSPSTGRPAGPANAHPPAGAKHEPHKKHPAYVKAQPGIKFFTDLVSSTHYRPAYPAYPKVSEAVWTAIQSREGCGPTKRW